MQRLKRWLQSHGAHEAGAGEWVMDCPFPECGKPQHLYVNENTGRWICHRCGNASRSIRKLLIQVDGFSWMKKGASFELPPEEKDEAEPERPTRITAPLPEEMIPVWDGKVWQFPKYLRTRGIGKEVARMMGLGFCNTGDYGGRIILPIRCPLGNSFTSRLVHQQGLRYKAGPNAGQLLYGWPSLSFFEGPVVLVEGPFDALSVMEAGLSSIALMGKKLSRGKTDLLNTLTRTLVVMLDEEAPKENVKVARELGCTIALAIDDPGNMSPKEIHKAVEEPLSVEAYLARYITLRNRALAGQ